MTIVQYHPVTGFNTTIPKAIARAFGIEKGDTLEYHIENGRIWLEIIKKESL